MVTLLLYSKNKHQYYNEAFRGFLAIETINGKIYAIGGENNSGVLNTVEQYDTATDAWTTKTNIKYTLKGAATASVNNKIYVIEGLGTTYYTMCQEYSPETQPNAPSNLTATGRDGIVTLNWDTVKNADSYNVKRASNAGSPYTTISTGVAAVNYTDNNVINGTTYYYVVTAVTSGT